MSNKSFLNFCHPLYLHLLYLTNGQWFWYLLDCTDNNIGHHINQNVVKSVGCTLLLCNILTTVNVVVDKSTDHAKPLSICFFFYHNIEVILSDSLTAWLLCDMLTWAVLSVLLLLRATQQIRFWHYCQLIKKYHDKAPHLRSPSVMSSLALPTLPPPYKNLPCLKAK